LKDPRARAEYLLKLRGREVAKEEARSKDLVFLDEMLELRERLGEAGSESEVEPLRAEVRARYDGAIEWLRKFFDDGVGTEDDAAKHVEQLRFFERFLGELEARFEAV
jgi:molecular chaperone HscB